MFVRFLLHQSEIFSARRFYSFNRKSPISYRFQPCLSYSSVSKYEISTRWSSLWLGCIIGTYILVYSDCDNLGEDFSNKSPKESCLDQYSCIIVGAGTAGCTTAYLVAKWLHKHNVDGKVLLIDRGIDYFNKKNGPDPRIDAWWYNWGSFGESHQSIRENGSAFPVTATDHKGVGGCSTHDTRITFAMRPEQRKRVAKEMGWSFAQITSFFQAALNLMPLCRSIPTSEAFYTACIDVLTDQPSFNRVEGNEYKSDIILNSIAEPSLAMYEVNGVRWTPAWLLDESLRPANLVVLPDTAVNRITWEKSREEIKATGVEVKDVATGKLVQLRIKPYGEVLLTGGAFGSVAVLHRSGVGPATHLKSVGVEEVVIDNSEVGHGVDHIEVAVMFEWLEKWNDPSTAGPPKGGHMGWPLVILSEFLPSDHPYMASNASQQAIQSEYFEAHFGAGFAEPYTDFASVVATPSCIRPDMSAGFLAKIISMDPDQSLLVTHSEQTADLETLARGVYKTLALFETLQKHGMVGKQLQPPLFPFPISQVQESPTTSVLSEHNHRHLIDWIRENHWTVFHWACTCQAGLHGRVADEQFRLRTGPYYPAVVNNLRIGSAASLPELSEANPHLTVSAFAVALAEVATRGIVTRLGKDFVTPLELKNASSTDEPSEERGDGSNLSLHARRSGEEVPAVMDIAVRHAVAWQKAHSDGNN